MHSWSGVTQVLRMRTRSKVFDSVIVAQPIDVVKLRYEVPVVIHPYKVVYPI